MNSRQEGMILLTTIMMLVILALLVLSLMQNVFVYIKSTNQITANHDVFRQLETLAYKLDLTNPDCVIQDNDPNQLVDILLAKQGCVIINETRQYRYILGDMGLYPCLQIGVDETLYGSHHWMVTIASMQPPQMILQLRMASPDKIITCDTSLIRKIRPGVISWRKPNYLR